MGRARGKRPMQTLVLESIVENFWQIFAAEKIFNNISVSKFSKLVMQKF